MTEPDPPLDPRFEAPGTVKPGLASRPADKPLASSDADSDETLALLKLLALAQREVDAGKLTLARDVIA
jgi:hypothetical protein